MTHQHPTAREPGRTQALKTITTDLEKRVTSATTQVETVASALRDAQQGGALSGPSIAAPFTTNHRELFAGVEYELPVHVGADGPGAPT